MLPMENLTSSYPEFMKIVDLISMQNPLQRKQINNFISRQDADYWAYAEDICGTINQFFLRSEQEKIEAARSYSRMTMDFLREQIRFSKTGVYRLDDAHVAEKNVYSQPEVMRYYMVGLFLSYLLWPNHFKIISFFKTYIQQVPAIESYLEIAPGHGLFAMEVMRRFPGLKSTLLDISETSIRVTGEILAAFQVAPSRLRFINGDFLSVLIEGDGFDFVSMGEVLEHVNDPARFLQRACRLLRPGGTIFMSTCVNCPAIDHVYNFRNADEIRNMIYGSGLSILKDRVLPVEIMSEARCREGLAAINYCSILVKE
jgi:SAM-dependent methyltransferase